MEQHCKSCGKLIRYLRHETTGNRAPIDVSVSPNGNIEILDDDTYRVLSGDAKAEALSKRPYGLYTNHFQTCVHADRHRPQRRQARPPRGHAQPI